MNRTPREELQLEVEDLTELLRTDDALADLRAVLISHGMRPEDVLLGGLIEGEDESSYGVFVASDGACTVFETVRSGEVIRWERVEEPSTFRSAFGAIDVAVSLATGRR
jgi:hypothetical protein